MPKICRHPQCSVQTNNTSGFCSIQCMNDVTRRKVVTTLVTKLQNLPSHTIHSHPNRFTDDAIEMIDSSVFSSDCGGIDGVRYLKDKCKRWLRGLKDLEETLSE